MDVAILDEASEEMKNLPVKERTALLHALDKLEVLGDGLGYPHTSAVRGSGAGGLRELRPRAGRSPWRGLYQRMNDTLVLAAIGPEAQHDQRGFDRARRRALERLAAVGGE